MILITDTPARQSIRDFLANTAKYCLETKGLLAHFNEAVNNQNAATTPAAKKAWEDEAVNRLRAAQERADRLIKHVQLGLPKEALAHIS